MKDCQFGVSPVNYSDSDVLDYLEGHDVFQDIAKDTGKGNGMVVYRSAGQPVFRYTSVTRATPWCGQV